jgi:hypothetical protein
LYLDETDLFSNLNYVNSTVSARAMSQTLLTKLNIRRNYKSQGWRFEGTVDESDLKTFCEEEKILFDDFMKVRVTFLIVHEHPLLFDAWDRG